MTSSNYHANIRVTSTNLKGSGIDSTADYEDLA